MRKESVRVIHIQLNRDQGLRMGVVRHSFGHLISDTSQGPYRHSISLISVFTRLQKKLKFVF